MPTPSPRALVVSTALRPGNKTTTAARFLADRLTADGATVDLVDLATEPLPACDGATCYADERVIAMTKRVEAADLIAVCFPVYNYQPNAAAKNFVELTNAAWKDKVVTFVANAGGDRSFLAPLPLANALMVDHRCVIVPQFLYLPPAAFDAAGAIALDPLAAEVFDGQVAAALRLASTWSSGGASGGASRPKPAGTLPARAPSPAGPAVPPPAPPAVGLGLWKIAKPVVADIVEEAVRIGYRHLDSACDYGNEAEAGDGIRRALSAGLCRRDELWVTSKLWNTFHDPRDVRPACERTLRDLGLDHLDLYLVHFPIALEYVPPETRYPPGWFFDPDAARPAMRPARVPLADTWGAMEDLVQAGLVRSIGVCNYGVSLLRDLLAQARVRPAVLQVELHPYLAQDKLLRFCRDERIAVTAFSPLGAPSYVPLGMASAADGVLDHPVVVATARAVGRTPAQVVLRWAVQRGTGVIPKTSRPERLRENIALFDFALSAEQMAAITALDRGRRFNDPGVFCEAAFNTFFPIYE